MFSIFSGVPKRGRFKRGRSQKHAHERKRAQMSVKDRKRKSTKERRKERKRAQRSASVQKLQATRSETTRFGNFPFFLFAQRRRKRRSAKGSVLQEMTEAMWTSSGTPLLNEINPKIVKSQTGDLQKGSAERGFSHLL